MTRHMAVLLLFFALAVVWLRPLPWQMGDHVTSPGDPLTTAWRLVWPAQWLLHRDAPFWDTNILYPTSHVLARDELTLGESLVGGPIYAITNNALLAYNLTLLLTLALCGFTMYCLAWHFLRNRTASIIAGMVFTLAPYHLAQLDHAGLLAVQWLPLEVLFLDRALRYRRWRDASLLCLTAFLQAIAAGYYAYWSAIVLLLFTGYVFLSRRYRFSVRMAAPVVVGLGVAFVALIPIVLPFARIAAREAFARPLHEVAYWSARPQTWLAATPNNLLYGPLVRAHAWTWSTEPYLFPGTIALLLAIIAILAGWRQRIRPLALALTVCGFILTLGPALHLTRHDTGLLPLPYALLYRFVPGGDALRAPIRAAPVAMLGLALLAAIGWKEIAIRIRTHIPHRRVAAIIGTVVCAALCAEYATAPLHTVYVPQIDARTTSLVDWLQGEPASIVAVLPELRAPVVMALATMNHHRFINGDTEILPPATRALFGALTDFPSPGSVAALEAIGVNLIVLDRSAYDAVALENVRERVHASAPEIALAASLPDVLVFRVAPGGGHFGPLHAAIPPSASVFLSGVGVNDSTYLERALVSQLLHDRRVCGDLKTGWTSEPASPQPGEHFDYGIFGVSEEVPSMYDRSAPVWSDGVLAAYRAYSWEASTPAIRTASPSPRGTTAPMTVASGIIARIAST